MMKKETIFRHEINESMAASAAMSCLRNRNNPKQLNETSDFDNRFALRKDLKGMANDVTKKAYMLIRKEFGDSMWRQLGMDDCDEQGLISQINDYQKYYGITDPQAIVNKMLGRKATEQEETVDIPQLAEDVVASYRGRLSKMDEKERVNFISTMVMKKMGKTIDTLTPQEKKEIISAAKHSMWYVSEQEEFTAYDDTDGIWMIINLMRKKGMLRAQGIEGRDDVDDGLAIDAAYDLIEQKLNYEGMWIGEDDHEAERFVSFFGDEIAEEAMKSALHNQEQEELPQMERHDMILAISQVLDESFGVDDNDGDLDDIYYAVARFLNLMTYYTPESEKDIMNWCREWHEDIAEIINTPADGNVLKGFVDDAFECLLEEGGCPEFYDLPKEQVKQAIYKALCNTPESELPWGRHYAINSWTKANVQKIRKFLTK